MRYASPEHLSPLDQPSPGFQVPLIRNIPSPVMIGSESLSRPLVDPWVATAHGAKYPGAPAVQQVPRIFPCTGTLSGMPQALYPAFGRHVRNRWDDSHAAADPYAAAGSDRSPAARMRWPGRPGHPHGARASTRLVAGRGVQSGWWFWSVMLRWSMVFSTVLESRGL